MTGPKGWSFQHINSFTPYFLNIPAGDTLAYWLGVSPREVNDEFLRSYDWHGQMSAQLNLEEQAYDAADLCSDPELIPARFRPVAPVTLSRLWSPFPVACDRWGDPIYSRLDDRGRAIAAWKPTEAWRSLKEPRGDVAHFEMLAAHATALAIAACGSVVLIAEPGWAYNSPDRLYSSKRLRRLMKEFGFVVSQRKPRNA
jgi:hypothetical protein